LPDGAKTGWLHSESAVRVNPFRVKEDDELNLWRPRGALGQGTREAEGTDPRAGFSAGTYIEDGDLTIPSLPPAITE
jgi:hypothetical protein